MEVTVRQAEADDGDGDEEDDDFLPDATERDIDDVRPRPPSGLLFGFDLSLWTTGMHAWGSQLQEQHV